MEQRYREREAETGRKCRLRCLSGDPGNSRKGRKPPKSCGRSSVVKTASRGFPRADRAKILLLESKILQKEDANSELLK
jgi:hypothetical protein